MRSKFFRKNKKTDSVQVVHGKPQQSQDLFADEEYEQEWKFVDNESATENSHSMDAEETSKAIDELMAIEGEIVAIDQENISHVTVVVDENPQTTDQEIFPSYGFESEHINVEEIIAGLVSQVDSQTQNPTKCDAMTQQASPIDPKTLSFDNLILMWSESQKRVDDLIAEIKNES